MSEESSTEWSWPSKHRAHSDRLRRQMADPAFASKRLAGMRSSERFKASRIETLKKRLDAQRGGPIPEGFEDEYRALRKKRLPIPEAYALVLKMAKKARPKN